MIFSANLGFLWTDRDLPDAVRAAHRAGFGAVEFHWPYDTPTAAVRAALRDTGLPVISLNTRRGNVAAGENGLGAVPGRGAEARAAVDEALAYGQAIGARRVHVMAGKAQGDAARAAFLETLRYACARARPLGIGLLIEPLNHFDAPGYFLSTTDQAIGVLDALDDDTASLMFDCYHVQVMEGDLSRRLASLLPRIGHVQFAGVPDRGPPGQGEVNYRHIFRTLAALGYRRPLGAEYKPGGATEASLGWMRPVGQGGLLSGP